MTALSRSVAARMEIPPKLLDDAVKAARKAKHVPTYYGKVLFLTKDQQRLRWVREDGSLGNDVDLDDLNELREWLRSTRPTQESLQ